MRYLLAMLMLAGLVIASPMGSGTPMGGGGNDSSNYLLDWPNRYEPQTVIDMSDPRVLLGSTKTFAAANSAADNTIALQWAIDNYNLVTINTGNTSVTPYLITGIQIKYNNRSIWIASDVYIKLADNSNKPLIYTAYGLSRIDLRGGNWDINKKYQGQFESDDIKEGVVKFAVNVTKSNPAIVTVVQHIISLHEVRATTVWNAAGTVMTNENAKWKTVAGDEVSPGDVVCVQAGNNSTNGFYTVQSVTSDTEIVLSSSIGANPSEVAYQIFRGHGYSNSSTIYFADFVGDYAALNGSHVISNASGCTFTIPVDTTRYTGDFDFSDSRIVTNRANCWRIRENGRIHYNPTYDYSYESFLFNHIKGLSVQNLTLYDSTSEDNNKAGKRLSVVGCNDVLIKSVTLGPGIWTGGGVGFAIYGPCNNVLLDNIAGAMKDDLTGIFDRDWDKQWWYGYGGQTKNVTFRNVRMGSATEPATNGCHLLNKKYPMKNITIENFSGYVTTNVVHTRGDMAYGEVGLNKTLLWDPSRTFTRTQIENLKINNVFCYAGNRSGGNDIGYGEPLFSINNRIGGSVIVTNAKNLHSGSLATVWANDRIAHWDSVVIKSVAVVPSSAANICTFGGEYATDLCTYHFISIDGINNKFPSIVGKTAAIKGGCTVDTLNLSNIRQENGFAIFGDGGSGTLTLNVTNIVYKNPVTYSAIFYPVSSKVINLTYSGLKLESGNVNTLLAAVEQPNITFNVTGSGYVNNSAATMRWYKDATGSSINLIQPYDCTTNGATTY